MYGFMCVALTSSIWDNLATQLALPVSMTHTTGVPLCQTATPLACPKPRCVYVAFAADPMHVC